MRADLVRIVARAKSAARGGEHNHTHAGVGGRGSEHGVGRYSPDMSKHAFLGTDKRIAQVQKDYAPKL